MQVIVKDLMFFQKSEPVSQLWLNRFFIAVIVVLALIAGYFFTENQRLAELCQRSSLKYSVIGFLQQ